jgi:type II secretory pathway component PulF
MGQFPVEVTEQKGRVAQVRAAAGAQRRKVRRSDVTTFTRQISDLIAGGLPLDRCLTVMIDQSENPGLRALLTEVQQEVRGGMPLSEALTAYPHIFNSMYTNIVRAGEASGQLAEVTERLAGFLEKEQVRKSQVVSAMVYPGVLLTVAVLAVTFLLFFVVPQLSSVFTDMGSALPAPTVLLLTVTGLLGKYWHYLLVGGGASVVLFKAYARTDGGHKALDRFWMRAPVVGKIVRQMVISRFARSFGTLTAGGVTLLESLEISGEAAGNLVMKDSVDQLIATTRSGENLADGMKKAGHFPPVLIHMTAVGEETGDLPRMLSRVADSLDFEVDATMRRLTTMLEPLIVLSMGGFVGFVVLSILLPIFQANSAVK